MLPPAQPSSQFLQLTCWIHGPPPLNCSARRRCHLSGDLDRPLRNRLCLLGGQKFDFIDSSHARDLFHIIIIIIIIIITSSPLTPPPDELYHIHICDNLIIFPSF
ncbi:unnamed protein product [Dibothriocephalus latus]|uniref:Uncharacterized protein n=1 Tax=Dibothriocephalus latus TaxID=60516 RepID=A0A3P6T2U8_DIBLA|nr:unnamed protein product [Dibothriocephalus latus]